MLDKVKCTVLFVQDMLAINPMEMRDTVEPIPVQENVWLENARL